MDTIQQLKDELTQEFEITKKFFEIYPEGKEDYAPHEKSMKLGPLVNHLADIFNWPGFILDTEQLDFAKTDYRPASFKSRKELLDVLNKNYNSSKEHLEQAKEADLEPSWSFANNGQILAKWTKYGAIRHAFSQAIHHRAQLGVYYRLLNISLPATYGPSADSQ